MEPPHNFDACLSTLERSVDARELITFEGVAAGAVGGVGRRRAASDAHPGGAAATIVGTASHS